MNVGICCVLLSLAMIAMAPAASSQECGSNEYRCANKRQCIKATNQCDKWKDCEDNSDEDAKLMDPEKHFLCTSGECVKATWVCDGEKDCDDGSDESNCESTCASDQLTCKDGECFPWADFCNVKIDCDDGSDEDYCAKYHCRTTKEKDEEGNYQDKYIKHLLLCDGKDDCGDNSDEDPSVCNYDCLEGYFQCANHRCIKKELECNYWNDCNDNSDEVECACDPETEIQCDGGGCFKKEWKCDGYKDCFDKSDEKNCEAGETDNYVSPCLEGEVVCDNTDCIADPFDDVVCNGVKECSDGSDERICCDDSKFNCQDGECIDLHLECDGNNDCKDKSDEFTYCDQSGTYLFGCEKKSCDVIF